MHAPGDADDPNGSGHATQHGLENLLGRPHRATAALPLPGWDALPGEALPTYSGDEAESLPIRPEGTQLRPGDRQIAAVWLPTKTANWSSNARL